MPVYPTLAQKKIIHDCFNRPNHYTEGAWPLDKPLPMGTKFKCADGKAEFYVPTDASTSYSIRMLDLNLPSLQTNGHYSATLGDKQVFFHMSKSFDTTLDLDATPEARRHYWYIPPGKSDKNNENDNEKRQQCNREDAGKYGISMGYKVYFRVRGNPFEKVVKGVRSNKNEQGFLKSVSHSHKGYVEQNMRGYQVAPQLYFFPPVIRQTRQGYKKVEFLRNMGGNLSELLVGMRRARKRLSFERKEALIHELLLQYLEQVADKHIIHTDIKLMNTCIKARQDADRPFEVTFIDFDEAFIRAPNSTAPNPPIEATGTPGSIAPELFIAPLPHHEQMTLAQADTEAYEQRLKPGYQALLCQETDIFALGVMLEQLNLSDASRFYGLKEAMLSLNPQDRPTPGAIRQVLDDPMPYYQVGP